MSAALKLATGEDLRRVRTEQAMTVRQLGRLADLSPRSIRRIEAGEQTPTPAVWGRLRDALQADSIAVASAALGLAPGSREELFNAVPWECDPVAQAIVRAFPNGMTYEQIAEFTGLDPTTVARIEQEALAALAVHFGDADAYFDATADDGSNEFPLACPKLQRDMLFGTRERSAAKPD